MSEPKEKKRIYCAIYTRKSTSEGLEQEFTSLDAQREACVSYVASQKNEGWIALPDIYDDGGFTGSNMDRPAVQKLISDIKDGRIDCVVVYKVDRLSRSLLDFSKLLEFFDKHNVTFVSITQQFNTNSSMGRLTLNILLSFAQFEREIISERTRDKMAAARKKGRWVGGRPVLGYDLDPETKKLTVNETDAALVKKIFELYLKEKSLLQVAIILNKEGHTTKRHITRNGKVIEGCAFRNTKIQYVIRNAVYLGKVNYQGKIYDGLHDPIISQETFDKAKAILAGNRAKREVTRNTKNVGLLNHILKCKACDSTMFLTYTQKEGKKYRYYVCMSAQKEGYKSCPTRSINAQSIEEAVLAGLQKIANDSELKDKKISQLQARLAQETLELSDEQDTLNKDIRDISTKIQEIKDSLKLGPSKNHLSEKELLKLKDDLEEKERLLSNVRVKKVESEERLLNDKELTEALVVISPAWDSLFPQEKRRILRLLLREVDYDVKTEKLGITLSEKGIKLLCSDLKGGPSGKE